MEATSPCRNNNHKTQRRRSSRSNASTPAKPETENRSAVHEFATRKATNSEKTLSKLRRSLKRNQNITPNLCVKFADTLTFQQGIVTKESSNRHTLYLAKSHTRRKKILKTEIVDANSRNTNDRSTKLNAQLKKTMKVSLKKSYFTSQPE